MMEIGFRARQGQGIEEAAFILAHAGTAAGKHVHMMPEWDDKRKGKPNRAYVKLSEEYMRDYTPSRNGAPNNFDVVAVLDPTLYEVIDPRAESRADAPLYVNSAGHDVPDESAATVDMSSIAEETGSRTAVVLAGVVAGAEAPVSLADLSEGVEARFDDPEPHLHAVERGYEAGEELA